MTKKILIFTFIALCALGFFLLNHKKTLQMTSVKVCDEKGKEVKTIEIAIRRYLPPIQEANLIFSKEAKSQPWWPNQETLYVSSTASYEDVTRYLTKKTIEVSHLDRESFKKISESRRNAKNRNEISHSTYYHMGEVEIDGKLFGVLVENVLKAQQEYRNNRPSDSAGYYQIQDGIWKSDVPEGGMNLLTQLPFRDPDLIDAIIKKQKLYLNRDGEVSVDPPK